MCANRVIRSVSPRVSEVTYFLSDNGSLRAEAWRNLCRVAAALSTELSARVTAASVMHSDRIPPEALDGGRACVIEAALAQGLKSGQRSFCIIPFFIGPTRAVTQYLPKLVRKVSKDYQDVNVWRTPFVSGGCIDEDDADLLDLLTSRVTDVLDREQLVCPPVILVDHGSPEPEVTAVRDRLAELLSQRLKGRVLWVRPASMERREGAQYAFNEPLLERVLASKELRDQSVIIAQLFLAPGRHAGERGDVAAICSRAEAQMPGLRTVRTAVLGIDAAIVGILARRVRMKAQWQRILGGAVEC